MRKVPPVLVVAIALGMFAALLGLAWPEPSSVKLSFSTSALWFASNALFVAGSLELARGLSGAARVGARVAAYATITTMASSVLWAWLPRLWHEAPWDTITKVWGWAWLALALAIAVGLAIAAWSRRGLAIAGLAIAGLANLSQLLVPRILDWLHGGLPMFYRLQAVRSFVEFSGLAVLVAAAAHDHVAPDTRRAAAGLRRLGGALRARVVAKLVVAGMTMLLAAGSSGGDGAHNLYRLALMSAAIIEILAQLFAIAGVSEAASANVADLPRWPLAVAAAGIAWCAGAIVEQMPLLHETLYSDPESFTRDAVHALDNIMPLVLTGSIAVVAAVISILANRRGNAQLGEHASGKGVGFVALMLSSIGIMAWVVGHAGSPGGLLIMLLCAAVAAIVGQLMMAKLCHLGADALEAEPGLPTATVV